MVFVGRVQGHDSFTVMTMAGRNRDPEPHTRGSHLSTLRE